jgi:potassium-transporting ATPase KdpC subunit
MPSTSSEPVNSLLREAKASLFLTAALVVVCCAAYPAAVWAASRLLFPAQAAGSLIVAGDGTVRGSLLIGQSFSKPGYFHPRPSAAGTGYDPTASGGTNLGPTSARLLHGSHALDARGRPVDAPDNFDGIADLVAAYRAENGLGPDAPVPADAVTRSASGLDPHISPANALLQAPRVARERRLGLQEVRALIEDCTDRRGLGVLGEPGVNVLELNLALDRSVRRR